MKKICLSSILIAIFITLTATVVPVFADEFKTGDIPLPGDHEVVMPDKYMSFSDIKSGLGKGDLSVDSTDYTPRAELPSSYPGGSHDEIKEILVNRYPLPKFQESFGTCWAFSVNGCAELGRIAHGKADKDIDLSELYLSAGIYRNRKNPVVGDEEAMGGIDTRGLSDAELMDVGANYWIAGEYLSKGFGYINESDLPYTKDRSDPRFDSDENLNLDMDSLQKKSVLQMTDMYLVDIDTENGRDIIKEAVMQNAAAGIRIHWVTTQAELDLNFDSVHASYCLPVSSNVAMNHEVCIVGWDDDFKKEDFINQPAHDGAWLVRNSWGSDERDLYDYRNYFWISYECPSIGNDAYIFDTDDHVNYDRNYYYDTQIHDINTFLYLDEDGMVANVFKAGENSNEKLKEVVIQTGGPLSYEINIYRNLKDISNPESGELIDEATVSGYTGLGGIFTIPLKEEVLLEKDSLFSVVVKSRAESVLYEVSLMNFVGKMDIEVGMKKNQSFFYDPDKNKWLDLYDVVGELYYDVIGNFCIYAHTSYTDEKEMEVKFKDVSGREVTLIYDTEYGTYKTQDGKYVLMLSDAGSGDVPAQKYQYTGKKITPSKKSYIIYKGILYEYKTDYSIGFKKNKKRGSATATVKWKKNSAPRKDGVKKSIMNFDVVERSVTEDMLSFTVKNGKIKKLRVTAEGIKMKPKKDDYSYQAASEGGYLFSFKNNYKGEVLKK